MNLEQIITRMNEIAALVEKSENADEVRSLTAEYQKLSEDKAVLEARGTVVPVVANVERRGLPIAGVSGNQEPKDATDSVEYRNAFREYVRTGKDSPILRSVREQRADAVTKTTDLSAVIPTTIMNRVLQTLKDFGDIWPRVTKLNVKAGIEFPIAGTKPTATWVAEGTTAEKQKKEITGKVSFLYHKLQIKMAATLEAHLVSLDVFEQIVAENMAEAMVVALEEAIFNGTGTGQPLGILNDTRVKAAQKHNFAAADATWKGWKTKLFAKIPSAYRKTKKGIILVDYGTWDDIMDGMVDEQGQPVARTTHGINGEEVLRFMGYNVLPIPYLPAFADATTGDVFLIYMDLAEYAVNSQLNITYRKYFDENTDEEIEKLTLIADGKLLDVDGIVMLKKA